MPAALNIWMNGRHVGVWSTSRNGVPIFRYETSWVQSRDARALSLSLPITAGPAEHRGNIVVNYFENLLPESGDVRSRLKARFRTRSTSAFDLLSAIGRDCVGAVQILPEDVQPTGWNEVASDRLTDSDVERILIATTSSAPLGQADGEADFRISIAGAQEKTALLRFGGAWRRPLGATPTTHILKLPLGLIGHLQFDLRDSVENEWLCAQIVRAFGVPIANCAMATFGTQKALVVERFDRRWQGVREGVQNKLGFEPVEGTWIARLPQEDMCQATGVPPTLKHESDGGPSMETCLNILRAGDHPETDSSDFLVTQLVFWILAATDGHAKNFSIHHRRGGNFSLTPLYDVISAWPIIGEGPGLISERRARLAMAVHGRNTDYRIHDIHARHWKSLADRCGVQGVWERMASTVSRTEAVFEQVQSLISPEFPEQLWDRVKRGALGQAHRFIREAEQLNAVAA